MLEFLLSCLESVFKVLHARDKRDLFLRCRPHDMLGDLVLPGAHALCLRHERAALVVDTHEHVKVDSNVLFGRTGLHQLEVFPDKFDIEHKSGMTYPTMQYPARQLRPAEYPALLREIPQCPSL